MNRNLNIYFYKVEPQVQEEEYFNSQEILKNTFTFPNEGAFAKISDNCETIKDIEHSIWKSENWYQITKNGKRAKN